jgi:DNA polymerase IV
VEADRARKSIGAETTFAADLRHWDEVGPVLQPVFSKVWAACDRGGYSGRTATVKIKYATFQQITRSHSCDGPIGSQRELQEISLGLLRPYFPATPAVRLLGVTLSNLGVAAPQDRMQLALCLAPKNQPEA